MKHSLSGLLPAEIAETCGFTERFRGLQIFTDIVKGKKSFEEMSSLPKDFRIRLETGFSVFSSSVEEEISGGDGTVKLKIRLADGNSVECVLLVDSEGRKTACVSCQVGCPLACAFCKTGSLGFARNLTVSEIADQFIFLNARYGPISNVVYMGMGEPTLNLGPVLASVRYLEFKDGFNLSKRKVTISTAGNADGIREIADSGLGLRLAVSLTVADQEARARLMPIALRYPLPELKAAIEYYQEKTKERVTLEAAIMGNANASVEDAGKLAEWCRGLDAQVNVIPWNPVPGLSFTEPSRNQVERFERELERLNVNVSRRAKRGRGVSGACGQLGEVKKT